MKNDHYFQHKKKRSGKDHKNEKIEKAPVSNEFVSFILLRIIKFFIGFIGTIIISRAKFVFISSGILVAGYSKVLFISSH